VEYFAASRPASRLVHIPYKGTGPALTDLLGGHIPMAFAGRSRPSHPNVTCRQICARLGGDQHDPLEPDA